MNYSCGKSLFNIYTAFHFQVATLDGEHWPSDRALCVLSFENAGSADEWLKEGKAVVNVNDWSKGTEVSVVLVRMSEVQKFTPSSIRKHKLNFFGQLICK